MIVGSVIKYIRALLLRKKWRELNSHNSTYLHWVPRNENFFRQVSVGRHTYGPIWAAWSGNAKEQLVIGHYCSIGGGVKFLIGSEHGYKSLSTFPFKVKFFGDAFEAITKGPIIVKDDVWIGENALILSGVTINQGAIVAAGAVVTKDVPAYAIVGGNPARVIKYRFPDTVCETLKKFDWGTLEPRDRARYENILYEEITESNINGILERLER